MHFFSKKKCTPIFSDFVAQYEINNSCHKLVSLKIRGCDNSHSKLYNNVIFAVHTLYMMHPMLNYSLSNPVDTHLKNKMVKSISKPPIKDNRSIGNAEEL